MIEVETLVLAIPGLTSEQASTLALDVSENLSTALPVCRQDINLNDIHVKIHEDRLGKPHLLAGYISDQIIQSINFSISSKL